MSDDLSDTGIVVLIALVLIVVPIAAVCLEDNSRKGSKIAKKRRRKEDKAFKEWYKTIKKVPFERVYTSVYELIEGSLLKRGITDASFEIHCLLFFLTVNLRKSEVGFHQTYKRLLEFQADTVPGFGSDEWQSRFKLYCDVVDGEVEVIGDSILPLDNLQKYEPYIKTLVLFSDLACYKQHREDYENSPVVIQSIYKLREQTNMLLSEIMVTTDFYTKYLWKRLEDGLTV